MEDNYTINGYNITTDPEMNRERYGITPQLQKHIDKLYFECKERKNKKVIGKIKQLIGQYPGVPQLKNFLTIAYLTQGRIDLVEETNKQILEEHPDYIFAQLNMANLYIDKKEFEKVPEILGTELELKALCPERDVFHLAEFTNFFKVVIRYYAAIKDLESAENRLKLMKEVAPEHPDTETAETFLFPLRLENMSEKITKEREAAINPVVMLQAQETNFDKAPVFKHPEILYLYQYGIGIPHKKMTELLHLPVASLTTDLVEVLTDALRRYGYFKNQGWEEESHTFAIHAFMLLGEIKAENALPPVLDFLSYDSDFLDFWLGDHLTENIWMCIYKMSEHNPHKLNEFLKKPGIETYCKSLVEEALCQIVHCHPERRGEIIAILSDVLDCFIKTTPNENLLDTDFLSLLIWGITDARLHELIPLVKQAFELGYVNESICGTWKDIEKDLSSMSPPFNKRKILSIFDLYDKILNTWYGYNNDKKEDFDKSDDIDADYADEADNEPYIRTEKKTGRNDPCPCGSGKKYKKCCLKN